MPHPQCRFCPPPTAYSTRPTEVHLISGPRLPATAIYFAGVRIDLIPRPWSLPVRVMFSVGKWAMATMILPLSHQMPRWGLGMGLVLGGWVAVGFLPRCRMPERHYFACRITGQEMSDKGRFFGSFYTLEVPDGLS